MVLVRVDNTLEFSLRVGLHLTELVQEEEFCKAVAPLRTICSKDKCRSQVFYTTWMCTTTEAATITSRLHSDS